MLLGNSTCTYARTLLKWGLQNYTLCLCWSRHGLFTGGRSYKRGNSFEKVHWRKGLIRQCERIKSHSKLTHYYSNIEFVAFLQQFFLVFLDKFFNLVEKKRQIKSNQKVPEMSVILILSISNGIINPLQPNISIHILHTAHHTFLKVLTRRICLVIKSFFC